MEANRNFNLGLIRFTFTDSESGEVFASFKLNPTSVVTIERFGELSEYFESKRQDDQYLQNYSDIVEFDREITDKICYVLGYDARNDLFSQVTATTISSDGEIFALAVVDAIADALAPEIEKRVSHAQDQIERYTAKYSE